MKAAVTVILLMIFQNAISQAPVRDIADLSFMSGKWVTKGEWGDMEEHWSEPKGNSMMCSYRCVKEGKIVFYEFIVIE